MLDSVSVHIKEASDMAGSVSRNHLFQKLRAIPGLNVDRGLANLEGELESYLEMWRRFYREHKQFLRRLENTLSLALETGEWQYYRIRIHALTGILGKLGASKLSRRSWELEKCARDTDGNGGGECAVMGITYCALQTGGFITELENLGEALSFLKDD